MQRRVGTSSVPDCAFENLQIMDHTAAAKRPGNVLIDVTFPAPTKVARIWYPVSLAPLFQSCFARAHTQAFAYTHLTTQCVAYYSTQLPCHCRTPCQCRWAHSFRNWYTARLTIRATKDRAALSNKDKDCLQGLLNPMRRRIQVICGG